MEFFRNLLDAEPVTFDFKWLRGVHKDAFTGAHIDNVYMGRGTSELYTMWIPIGDVNVDMGTLAVVEGSNNDTKFNKLQVKVFQRIHDKFILIFLRKLMVAVIWRQKMFLGLDGSLKTPWRLKKGYLKCTNLFSLNLGLILGLIATGKQLTFQQAMF
jgi:hypothetical protein